MAGAGIAAAAARLADRGQKSTAIDRSSIMVFDILTSGYASAFLQNATHLAISVIRSEPAGTGYSISITPGNAILLLLHQSQSFLDGRVALAPRHVRAVMHLRSLR